MDTTVPLWALCARPPLERVTYCLGRTPVSSLEDSGGAGARGHAYGTIPSGIDTAAIIARATPAI
jgi:hypothetical protein